MLYKVKTMTQYYFDLINNTGLRIPNAIMVKTLLVYFTFGNVLSETTMKHYVTISILRFPSLLSAVVSRSRTKTFTRLDCTIVCCNSGNSTPFALNDTRAQQQHDRSLDGDRSVSVQKERNPIWVQSTSHFRAITAYDIGIDYKTIM